MKLTDRINYILVGILWLLASLLGTCFWMNVRYSFNILSKAHWEYLSELQISGKIINPSFYITILIAIFITLAVLYLLMRPHLKRTITLEQKNITLDKPKIQKNDFDDMGNIQKFKRPPRLNIPVSVSFRPTNTISTPTQQQINTNEQISQNTWEQIEQTFSENNCRFIKHLAIPPVKNVFLQ